MRAVTLLIIEVVSSAFNQLDSDGAVSKVGLTYHGSKILRMSDAS